MASNAQRKRDRKMGQREKRERLRTERRERNEGKPAKPPPQAKPVTSQPTGGNGDGEKQVAESGLAQPVSGSGDGSAQDSGHALTNEELWQLAIKPDQVAEVNIGDIIYIDPKRVLPDPKQVRKNFDREKLAETADSIEHEGQKDPVQIYRIFGDPNHDCMILDGQRRWTCCGRIGVPLIAQMVSVPRSEADKLGDQLTLNTGEGHDHMEVILAIQVFILAGKSVEWMARKFVRTTGWVYSYKICAEQLLPEVIAMLSSALPKNKRLRFPVARLLVKFRGGRQSEIAEKVRGKPMSQASPLVKRELGQAEDDTRGRRRPSRDRGTLETAFDTTIAQLSSLEMKTPDELARTFAQVTSEKAQEVLDSMTRENELNAGMQMRIFESLPEAVRAKVKAPAQPASTPQMQNETLPPPPELEPAPEPLNIEALPEEVTSSLESMLATMDALAMVIMPQKGELREIIEALPQEEREAVYERIVKATEAINWAKLRAKQAGGEKK